MFYKGQKLRLTKPLKQRTAYSIWEVPAGEFIEIQQVSERNRQVLVNNVWMHVNRIKESTEMLIDESQVYGIDCVNGRCEL